jgi:cellobiose epimerase
MSDPLFNRSLWKNEAREELLDHILPFWINQAVDRENGGFYGSLSPELVIDNQVERSAILTTRILWTFSAAYQYAPQSEYLNMANYAYQYIRQAFIDPLYGGLYWSINAQGQPLQDRKHSYVQAFAIYALSEYYCATQKAEALLLAQKLFGFLEQYAYEPGGGGYLEGRARDWGQLEDMRLSDKEPNCSKTMNSLLHILEAYTNLYRVWKDPLLYRRLCELIQIFFEHVINPDNNHLRLFFDNQWHAQGDMLSFGHDIEASWLLLEAAEVSGSIALVEKARAMQVKIAQAVFEDGLWPDGSIIYEKSPSHVNTERHWWPVAEGMVGFYTAYHLSQQPHFAQTARRCWQFALEKHSDRQYGDWRKVLDEQYRIKPGTYKLGPWECPYHQARACLEIIKRLDE